MDQSLISAMDTSEYQQLRRACQALEHPSLAVRLTNVVGTPIEMGLRLLPKRWFNRLRCTTEKAIGKALNTAIATMHHEQMLPAHQRRYRLLGAGAGALGGYFGLYALPVELPITTLIMLRAIADVARGEGEDLRSVEARLACMEVFALGGRSEEDDDAELGYYGLRLALAVPVAEAASYVAKFGCSHQGAPVLVRLVLAISQRFGFTLSEKAAAQLIPCIGAAGGALVNTLFVQHFQDMARGHFTVRRLERKYGVPMIEAEYAKIRAEIS